MFNARCIEARETSVHTSLVLFLWYCFSDRPELGNNRIWFESLYLGAQKGTGSHGFKASDRGCDMAHIHMLHVDLLRTDSPKGIVNTVTGSNYSMHFVAYIFTWIHFETQSFGCNDRSLPSR
jgi:hypothetical protein